MGMFQINFHSFFSSAAWEFFFRFRIRNLMVISGLFLLLFTHTIPHFGRNFPFFVYKVRDPYSCLLSNQNRSDNTTFWPNTYVPTSQSFSVWFKYLKKYRTPPIKLRQSRKQIRVSSVLPKNEWNSLSWVKNTLKLWVSFVFGRIEATIDCFQDLLTFQHLVFRCSGDWYDTFFWRFEPKFKTYWY